MRGWAWGVLGVLYVVLMWFVIDFRRVMRWFGRGKRR